MSQVTRLLECVERGESRAAEELLPLVYDELRRLAAIRMEAERPGQTLQATALVHEAYLRLVGQQTPEWANSRHFFSAAAEAMRRILIERARARGRKRRGGGQVRLNIDELDIAVDEADEVVLRVNDALEKLRSIDPACAELVHLRFFAGLPNDRAAAVLGMSDRTARRNWAYARAWLATELDEMSS